MTILQYLNSLRPALPLPGIKDSEGRHVTMSGSELKRTILQKGVLINGDNDWKFDDEIPPLIWQVVFYPKSDKKRTTLL